MICGGCKSKRRMKRIIIIGAGATGLGAGYRLRELGYGNFMIYERNTYAGGLCVSVKDKKGFTWDFGGHVIFSHYEYFDRLLEDALGNDYLEHKRDAWIRTMGKWVPYPFQNNIRHLPEDIMSECLEGLKKSLRQNNKSANFEEWIVNNLGEAIAKYFMFPHNFKVWTYPLHLLSADWIAERVSRVQLKEVVDNLTSGTDKTDWGPNVVFKYPLYNGVGAIFRKIATFLNHKIEFNAEITKIDPRLKRIYLCNGKVDTYDILINTSPLDKVLKLIKGCGNDLSNPSLELKHNSMFVVGIGMNQLCPSNKCWIYFPDNDCPFFRVTYLSNYSPNNTPDRKKYYSLLCESAYSEYKEGNKSEIIEKTIRGLINSGLIERNDVKFIVSRCLFHIDYAYPIPTLKRDEVLRKIQPELEKMDIYSRGRFGAWKYEIGNTDHSVMQGKEIVDRVLNKGTENVWSL